MINKNNISYKGDTIYLLYYSGNERNENIKESYGIIKEINKENIYDFRHF